MLAQEADVDPARVPEVTGAAIRRHRRRDRNRLDGVGDQPSPNGRLRDPWSEPPGDHDTQSGSRNPVRRDERYGGRPRRARPTRASRDDQAAPSQIEAPPVRLSRSERRAHGIAVAQSTRLPGYTHHRHDLIYRRRIGRVALAFVGGALPA
jgi:hypothetical protein